jgi:UDP-glucose 4-epimerase
VKQTVITGGAGFIGSHLAEVLLARGERVTVLDDESAGSPENLLAVRDHFDFNYVKGSAADRNVVESLLADADEVYHLAAAVGVGRIAADPIDSIERNVLPVQVLLSEAARSMRLGRSIRVFLASSSEVYGSNPAPQWKEEESIVLGPTSEPRWSYGAAKALDEFLALAYHRQCGLPVVIGRFFNVVGPRQTGSYGMVLPRFIESALAGRPPVVYDDGRQVRCFSHVVDVCQCVAELMETDRALGRVFNIGSNEPITIMELAEKVVAAVDPRLDIEFESYRSAYPGDFRDVRRRVPDLTTLHSVIAHRPKYSLDDVIREIVDWKRGSTAG